jgi:uncharacterized membrane protein YcaP (DUF421 family)
MWTLAADALGGRFPSASNVLTGPPVIIVRSGEPLMDQLRREKISIDELNEAARIHGFADLSEVAFCVLEADGEFSFIRDDHRSD